MIIVRNTKELEEQYNLNLIPDDEQIRVVGGMEDKSKYNSEKYERRTTYSARQLKQVIQQMKDIEEKIPESWNKWQRAKYIYDVLASNIEYNYDSSSYSNQQSSNLTVFMHRKGVCAGYALTFKEMMDRQGIECDYVRGIANENTNNPEKHAWNVLNIDGIQIPIDLTWDSVNKHLGRQELDYFGNDSSFFKSHRPDLDEKTYNFSLLNDEFVNSIDISQTRRKEKLNAEEKMNIFNSAIEQTYKKMENAYGDRQATEHIFVAIEKYIEEENAIGFTREGMARANIQKYFQKEDILDLLVEQYVEQCSTKQSLPEDILGNALRQNMSKYDITQSQVALKNYIISGNAQGFTRRK